MKIVRDREDARRLPTRFRFAIFRLLAFLRMLFSRPVERRGIILAIDRDQSVVEQFTVAIWITFTASAFLSVAMPMFVAIPMTAILLHVPMAIFGGLILPAGRNNLALNSIATMAAIAMAAAYFATTTSWLRFVAWSFFALLAINALAAVVMWTLRNAVQRMEQRCGL
jgi:hypothetical protein